MPDESGDVDRCLAIDLGEELGDILHGSAAVPDDDRGDPHSDVVLGVRESGDILGMGMHVDEARSNDHSFGVEGAISNAQVPSDADDLPFGDGDVGEKTWITGTVDDPTALDQEVVAGRRLIGGNPKKTEGANQQFHS